MRKADLITKEAILLTIENDKIIVDHFNECYLFNNKLSVRKQNSTYRRFYCNEGQDYYVTCGYCLITNLSKKYEGLECFINKIKDIVNRDISIHLSQIEKLNERLEIYESINVNSFFDKNNVN